MTTSSRLVIIYVVRNMRWVKTKVCPVDVELKPNLHPILRDRYIIKSVPLFSNQFFVDFLRPVLCRSRYIYIVISLMYNSYLEFTLFVVSRYFEHFSDTIHLYYILL